MISKIVRSSLLPGPSEFTDLTLMRRNGFAAVLFGDKVRGWLKLCENPQALVCFFHGNGENAADWSSALKVILHDYDAALLLVEYRGYTDGSEPVARSENQLMDDAISVVEQAKAAIQPAGLPVILWGRSVGGAVAAAVAAKIPVDGLLLESTFSSLKAIAVDAVIPGKLNPARVLAKLTLSIVPTGFKLDTAQHLQKIECPVLIAHSTDDETISFEHAQRNFAAANEPKRFVQFSGTHDEVKLDQVEFKEAIHWLANEIGQRT